MVIPNSATKVSAIVSIYKSKKYIHHKLENLISQTLFQQNELEIVLIDSNSPENEFEIINEYLKKYPNINYLRTPERESIYQAWNRAIKLSKSQYITNSNTDDILKEDALEIMAKELDMNEEIALVYSDYFISNHENSSFAKHIRSGYGIKPEYSQEIMATGCHMGPFPMWRTKIHDEIGFFSETYKSAGDYDFWCRVSDKFQMKRINQFLGLYYNNPSGYANSNVSIGLQETSSIKNSFLSTHSNLKKVHPVYDICYPKPTNDLICIVIICSTQNKLNEILNYIYNTMDFPHIIELIYLGENDISKIDEDVTKKIVNKRHVVDALLDKQIINKIIDSEYKASHVLLIQDVAYGPKKLFTKISDLFKYTDNNFVLTNRQNGRISFILLPRVSFDIANNKLHFNFDTISMLNEICKMTSTIFIEFDSLRLTKIYISSSIGFKTFKIIFNYLYIVLYLRVFKNKKFTKIFK